MVLARFRVSSVEAFQYGSKVNLQAHYSPDGTESPEILEEIRSFYDATPNGTLSMTINNDAAAEHFQPGDDFYIRLEKAPKQ